jgi:hypothetical protein
MKINAGLKSLPREGPLLPGHSVDTSITHSEKDKGIDLEEHGSE